MAAECPKCHFDNPPGTNFCGRCAASLAAGDVSFTRTLETPAGELTTGATFAGRYRIIEELGQGGMGKVFRVQDRELNEEIALKLIRPEIATDDKTVGRFKSELKLARRISHKNVGRMYELLEAEGIRFITMEYVPGEDLKSFIRRSGQLTVGTTIRIAKQVCEGLSEAHRLGVVHRDLKPSNIMIDKDGNARVMDFGIARSLKSEGLTGAGIMIGTPEYMSPEQVEAKDVDRRSDVYSLGVILYEMLTGRLPFQGDTPLAVAMKHKGEIPEDPGEFNANIPAELSRLILKCLEKSRENRYQTMDALRGDLDQIEQGFPTAEREISGRKPPSSREITVKLPLKKVIITAVLCAALAMTVLLIVVFLPKKAEVIPQTDKPALAVLYFKNNTGDEGLDIWKRALPESIITDLSQSRRINVLPGNILYGILRKHRLLEAEEYAAEDLREIAAEGEVNHVLQGSLARAGDMFRVDYTLQKISPAEILGSGRVEGKGEESLFAMVDALTRKIKEDFKLSEKEIAADLDKEIGTVTTGSLEAYKLYVQGNLSFNQTDYEAAVQHFRKAIEIDPGFATAYRSMAMAYSNLGRTSKRWEFLKRAAELSDRVSERERYRIEAEYYRKSEKTYGQAIAAFEKLLELYPDEGYGRNNLANVYRDIEEWDLAIEQYQWHIRNSVGYFAPYGNLAIIYRAKGMYEKAGEVLELGLERIPDHPRLLYYSAMTSLCRRKFDLTMAVVDRALSVDPAYQDNIQMKGDVFLCQGELRKAEEQYLRLQELDDPPAPLFGRLRLGVLYLLQGRHAEATHQLLKGMEHAETLGMFEERLRLHLILAHSHLSRGNLGQALEECDKAWRISTEAEDLSGQRKSRYFKGFVDIGMNAMDEARGAAESLKGLVREGKNRKDIRYYHNLTGRIELAEGRFSRAVEHLKKALATLPHEYNWYNDHTLFFAPLALAHYKAGDLDNAQSEYERIAALTVSRILFSDVFAESFYMLGKIYEQKGWPGKARESYEKFLGLRRDADPGLPEVEDARRRLAALK